VEISTMPSSNLAPQRGPSVWEKKSLQPNHEIFAPQRWAMGVTGGTVAAYGLSRRSWSGAVMALVGGGLALRAAAGHNDLDNLHDCLERTWAMWAGCAGTRDEVDNASAESFPASDPPSHVSPTRNKEMQRCS